MRGRCHHCFMLQILCLFLWRHLENISALLLRMCFLSAFIILNFSLRQRLRRFAPLLYGLARFKMDHFPKHWRHHFLVPRCSLIAQCPFHVPDHERISCGYCSVAWIQLLFNHGRPWVKRDILNMFDVTMGSNDGAEVFELIGHYIRNRLSEKYGKDYVGLYRDDGLILLKNVTGIDWRKKQKRIWCKFLKNST